MRYYETLYIINPNLSDEDYRSVVDKFTGVVEKNKGVVTHVDEWGKKTLAYNIKKFDKGSYVLTQFCGESDLIEELKREMGLDDRILKYQNIKLSDNADPEELKQVHSESNVETEKTGEPSTESASAEDEVEKDGL